MVYHPRHALIPWLISIGMAILPLSAASLSEQDALLSGLEHRYEIRILHVENRIDSLNVETARTQWLPQASASAGLSYQPHDTSRFVELMSSDTLYRGGALTSSVVTGETLSVAQQLPGGGVISGGATFNNQSFLHDGDSTLRSSTLALTYTQPLLRDAWRFGAVEHSVKIARLNNQEFSLGQKKQLLTYCSDLRTRFWKLYEAQALVALYRTESAYTEEQMNLERTRFSIGSAAPLDTLNARLSFINALARLHDAQSDELQAREELAFYAGMAAEAAGIDSATVITCPPLPPPDEMLRQAEQFDPQLRMFDVAAERLELTRAHTRNSLLPRIDVNASWQQSGSKNLPSNSERFFGNSVIGIIASYALPVKPRKLELSRTTASIEKNDLDREQYREQLRLKIRELNRSWERERRAIEIAVAARQIAEQTLAATREGFSVGTIDRLSLDKAENDFRSACIELLKKQLLMKQLEIVFDELTGATLSRLGVELQ
jgi:outer membrane protein TolC